MPLLARLTSILLLSFSTVTATPLSIYPINHSPRDSISNHDAPFPLTTTPNILPITHIRTRIRPLPLAGYPEYPVAPLGADYARIGLVPTIKAKLEGETFTFIFDTGSSDTWVTRKGFKCIDVNYQGVTVPNGTCSDVKRWKGGFPTGAIPNRNLKIAYEGGGSDALVGDLGYMNVTLAGLHINQTIGLVSSGYWTGGVSGLMGMAYPAVTGAFVGINSSLDDLYVDGNAVGDHHPYSPVPTSMIEQGVLGDGLFSVALNRSGGGYVAFGGLPPVQFDPAFVKVPIIKTNLNVYPPQYNHKYSFYTIKPDGYVLQNGTTGPTVFMNNSYPGIVDSGTPQLYVPSYIHTAYISSFNPPPTNLSNTLYYPCNATAPPFAIKIGGKVFNISSADILSTVGNYTDATGVVLCPIYVMDAAVAGVRVFGGAFLNNVVAVFNVGKGVMRFARHDY